MEHKLALLEEKFKSANSSEQKVETLNSLLEEFPLLFGYWLKLIELSTDKERDWSRALEECSVLELWVPYLASPFGSSLEAARTATAKLGYHFQSHPLWDALLKRTNNSPDVLRAVLRKPLYAYAQYFQLAMEQESETPDNLELLSREVAGQVSRKYEYESKIRRPYFHPHELGDEELHVWNEYLDYTEQSSGSNEEVRQLYDRCLVSTALYPRFWLRYIKWMAQHNIDDEWVCRRALRFHNSKVFRLLYSRTLESKGKLTQAREQLLHVDDIEQLVQYDRRHNQKLENQGQLYNVEYAVQSGDLSRLSLEELRESSGLFDSKSIDPSILFPLWDKSSCPNSKQYAQKLKETGNLREFFIVDSSLEFE